MPKDKELNILIRGQLLYKLDEGYCFNRITELTIGNKVLNRKDLIKLTERGKRGRKS